MKKIGKCYLCEKNSKLTFEHNPPEKANNSNGAHAILGDTLIHHMGNTRNPWDLSGLKYMINV